MTKEDFLTVRWNNILTLGLGIPALIYGIVMLSIPVLPDNVAYIGLVAIGVIY